MADPAYIDADGVLVDGEAWVALSTTEPTGTKLVSMTSANDGSSLDWSQYVDLVVVAASQSAGTVHEGDTLLGYFNNDTNSNYQVQYFRGNGSSVNVSRTTAAYMQVGNSLSVLVDSDISTSVIWHIFDINSGKYKSATSQWAATRAVPATWTVGFYSFVWQSTAAITEIDLNMENANYGAGSMISLFGILPRMVS